MNDIIINKIQSIQRCVARAREEYQSDPDGFDANYTAQDAASLNVLRACEQSIALANHFLKTHRMGIPTSSGESFDLLRDKCVIPSDLAEKLKKMVHFRNTVIHQYQQTNVDIVKSIVVSGLDDLIEFGDCIMAYIDGASS